MVFWSWTERDGSAKRRDATEMRDRNGVEIRTGDIVVVEGGYFARDNGRFLVTVSPGDEGWSGRYHSLKRLNKNGTLSKSKGSTSSWPLAPLVVSRIKRAEIRAYNDENASIEVVG